MLEAKSVHANCSGKLAAMPVKPKDGSLIRPVFSPRKKLIMKRFLLLPAALLLFDNCLHAQLRNDSLTRRSNVELSEYCALKAKHQRTAAWVLLGSGTALTIVGGAIAMSKFSNDLGNGFSNSSSAHYDAENVILGVGIASIVASVPYALLSSSNKRKAKLLLQNQTTFVSPRFYLKQATLTLGIRLGR